MIDKAIEAACKAFYDGLSIKWCDLKPPIQQYNRECMRSAIAAYESELCEDKTCSECGTPARRIFLLTHTACCSIGRVRPLPIEDDDPIPPTPEDEK